MSEILLGRQFMKNDQKNKQFNKIQIISWVYVNQNQLSAITNWEVVPSALKCILGKLLSMDDGLLARVFLQVIGVC